ncbi:MAG: alpha/beta hydrolase family protein [Haliea sp.]|nr:alpha/beta hydrolase family protein [Haliea sp.]
MRTTGPDVIPRLRRARLPQQSGKDALVTSLAALLDRSLMRTVALIVEKRVLPRDVDLDTLRQSIDAMLGSSLAGRPQEFFRFVQALEAPGDTAEGDLQSVTRRRIKGGHAWRRRLASHYRPHRQMPKTTAVAPKPDAIQFEHWVHEPDTALGSVIVLHGFAMGWPVIDAVAMSAGAWFERGFNVVLLTLPDHGPRRPAGSLFSGQNFTVPHAVMLAAAVRQAIYEIFALKRWLRRQGEQPVGLVGMSLGGYLASLCAGLSDDFDFLIPLVPPACMGDLAWRVYRATGHHRAGLDATLTEEKLRAAFYVHSPLAHPRKIARERILIAAGAGDRIVPPEHPSALWEHWERPAIHWLRGSHIAPVASKPLMRVITQHLRQLDLL